MKELNLPISIEKFAAYLDGKLSNDEMMAMQQIVAENSELHELKSAIDMIDEDIASFNTLESLEQDTLSNNLQLPIIEDSDILLDDIIINLESQINNQHNIMETKNYGYEPNYELENFDSDIFQGYSNTCAIRSQEIILRDYGIIIPQEELMNYAYQHNWYDPDPEKGGTDKYAVGNILDACGVETTRSENATIYDVIAELRAGHRVIVSVDADELWVKNEPNILKKLFGEASNRVNDSVQNFLGFEGANHALIVAGVNVNPNNPADMNVTLIDPGTGEICITYSFKDFYNAWKDGHCQMVSTNEPAPYQYNYITHQMEPSNIETSFIPSMVEKEMPAELSNHFVLAKSYYGTYEDHIPTYDDDNPICIDEIESLIMNYWEDETSKEDEHNVSIDDVSVTDYFDQPDNKNEEDYFPEDTHDTDEILSGDDIDDLFAENYESNEDDIEMY